MRLAVNLSTIFTEVPFLDRFEKARQSGFSYVECQFPYDHSIEDIKRRLADHQLSMVLLNLPAGNWEKGERGLAVNPEREDDFKRSVKEGIKYAVALNVANIHCMAGIVPEADAFHAYKTYVNNIAYAATEFQKHDLTLCIEPINTINMPGYFLHDLHQAAEILKKINKPNVKLQFDFYHIERIHGESLKLFRQYQQQIVHVQIADPPRRHQPGTGNLNFREIFRYLQGSFDGYVGFEYTPLHNSEDSFEWMKMI